MHILVTNDDGITAPGLMVLVQALRELGKVSILAPDHNWSASGHVRTLDRPLHTKEVTLNDGTKGWACDGAPSDCVSLAICGYFDEKVDMVVSGINPYANLGNDVTYSGTVTAAMEASIWGIPAIAVSVDSPDNHLGSVDYQATGKYARMIAQYVINNSLPAKTLLNVNVPYLPESKIKGAQVTRLGLRVYHDKLEKRTDPRGRPYYWTIGSSPSGIPEAGTDIGALSEGFVSITPVQLDMTDYHLLLKLHSTDFQQNHSKMSADLVSLYLPG
jgi:5'-nucleotidase